MSVEAKLTAKPNSLWARGQRPRAHIVHTFMIADYLTNVILRVAFHSGVVTR